jgi:nitrite reductase/ring-hydroxylating ferredoxin subunit
MRLCHLDELPDGGARGFDPQRRGQDSLLVVRQRRQLYGYVDACPHHGTPMAWRKDAYLNAARDRIVCAAHGAQFEIHSGRCVLGPCLGQALTPLLLTLHDDGEIHIADSPSKETPT